ncbi:GNAT family N-acetyltransferase [Tepidibacter hydrothermalis]|uniref:GNAT family N-acetyltransferase n=1 Tax=Tepidibacter hydrothermalis TaxID=3036126 RepID=A0ABY8EED8_9FIRM|nr:GNAT family N-acetyltransferase [Tepidibacter hydrothermalis]WFD11301.1 GNAT family N-acetyltransferase [Tepidibacter hydrothermalis]
MLKPDSAKIEEFEDVIKLINKVFRVSRGYNPTMQQEFPLLLNKDNINNMIVIKENGKIVSDVNYLIQDVLIQGINIKVASIGAVCTDPEHEGKRYSSKILDKVEEKMHDDGVDIVLISGDRSLYTRRMCSKVKNFYKYTLMPKDISLNIDIEEYDEKYKKEMIQIYNQNSTRYFRTREQFEILLKSATVPWGNYTYKKLVIRKDDKLIGYMIIRIIDNEEKKLGQIIELNLPCNYVHDTISYLAYKYDLNYLDYWVHVKDYKNHIEKYDEVCIDYLHGTIKIINYEKMCKSLYNYFIQYADKKVLDNIEFKELSGKYLIKYKDEELLIEDVECLNKLFFEGKIREDLSKKPNIEKFIKNVFPINFVWPANLNYQ